MMMRRPRMGLQVTGALLLAGGSVLQRGPDGDPPFGDQAQANGAVDRGHCS